MAASDISKKAVYGIIKKPQGQLTHLWLMFQLHGETRYLICISKLLEKKRWKSDIFSKIAGYWSTTVLKMSLFHRGFS